MIHRPGGSAHAGSVIDQQKPVPTPFTASSTAADVLAGLDLSGRNAIVTGGHSRLGREVSRALAAAGARVVVAARDVGTAEAAVGGLPGVEVEQLDLTVPESIDAFAARWSTAQRPLHMLVNNAAVLFGPERRLDDRGNELAFSTSHLGHFRLVDLLLPALRAAGASRVVNVTSGAARIGRIHWDDLSFAAGYHPVEAYAQSKLAGVLFAVELDRRHAGHGIRAFAAHPGVVIGPGPHAPGRLPSFRAQGLVDEHGATVIDPEVGKKTIEQGAATIVLGAASPLLEGVGGVYLKDADVAPIDDELRPMTADSIPADASSAMLDADAARRLWEVSERLVG